MGYHEICQAYINQLQHLSQFKIFSATNTQFFISTGFLQYEDAL